MEIRLSVCDWEKYNGRTDVKVKSWFRFQNNFFDNNKINNLSIEEKLIFIWLLCEASKCENDMFFIGDSFLRHIQRIHQRSTQQSVQRTIEKLKQLQLIEVRTIRGRYAGVKVLDATLHDITEHDITEHDKGEKSPVDDLNDFDLEFIYKSYPKRLGDQRKKVGMARLKKLIKNRVDYDLAIKAVSNYYAMQQKNGKIGSEYIKQFGTFWDSYGDWVEWANINSDDSLKSDWKAKMMERLK